MSNLSSVQNIFTEGELMSRTISDHWTTDDHIATQQCENLSHLAQVGIRMLDRLRSEAPHGVTFLAGPMTTGGLGKFDLNMHLFEHCICIARERGLTVFNQVPFQHGLIRILNLSQSPTFHQTAKDYPHSIIKDFYWPLFESKGISHFLLLPTWISSNGATQELNKAISVGSNDIQEYPHDWYEDALNRSKPFVSERQGG